MKFYTDLIFDLLPRVISRMLPFEGLVQDEFSEFYSYGHFESLILWSSKCRPGVKEIMGPVCLRLRLIRLQLVPVYFY